VDYKEIEPTGPQRNGTPAGDSQVTDSWSRRFACDLGNGEWAVIGADFYTVDYDDGEGVILECQAEYVLCTDPNRPGDTEVWSDARYSEPGVDPTDEVARELCAAVDPGDLDWNGRPF
jgi:hypothetical protein